MGNASRRMRGLLPLGWVLATGVSSSPALCRCAQLTLERYFEEAKIVLVGTATSVRTVTPPGGAPRVEATFRPQFRPEPTFKGTLQGIVLATPTTSASCGVEVQTGQTYVIFATRDPGEPGIAWFTTCSGSRRYPGASDEAAFTGTENRQIIATLIELANSQSAAPAPTPSDFHTSPACWSEPRVFHTGSPPADVRDRLAVRWDTRIGVDTGGVRSPNNAYRASTPLAAGDERVVWVDAERTRQLRISARAALDIGEPRWINEKLLALRVIWGRISFTDLIIDVEQGRVIYQEQAGYGQAAFQQFQEQCIGQCPCLPVPGSAAELATAPRSRPAAGEAAGLDRLGENAYLDADWDGRVFTEAGGRRYVVSALKGTLDREEYAADVLEVRRIGQDVWLRVMIFEKSKCSDLDARAVHGGWVPAYSARGRLVAGTHPGGC